MELKIATKIEIKTSPGKGMGVFAVEPIKEGEVIEECHLIKLPTKKWETSSLLVDYRFCYPMGENWEDYVLPLGYGCIYNHNDNNNAMWRNHPIYRAFQFYALRDIEPGEEICTNYGPGYYWSGSKLNE
jgi:SET domain-containing protein